MNCKHDCIGILVFLFLFIFMGLGSCMGRSSLYDESCSAACKQIGEDFDFHENQLCVCTDTIFTSDLPRMWKPKK